MIPNIKRRELSGKIINSVYMLVVFSLPFLLFYRSAIDNDTYWLINNGKYILANGFPSFDPFTIHNGLHITVQQWLTAVIFFVLYNKAGFLLLILLKALCYFTTCFLIYFLSLKLGNGNRKASLALTVIAAFYLNFFFVLRPQMFSIIIFILELFLLELYSAGKSKLYLLLLPVLSLLLINLHAAMWPVFFIFYVPYIIDGFNIKTTLVRTQLYPLKALLTAFIVSAAAGFINPYGTENMLYLFKAYGVSEINSFIAEMKSPDFKSITGVVIFLLFSACIIVFVSVKSSLRLRHILIMLGTAYMALSSVRSTPLFLLAAAPFTAYYLRGLEIRHRVGDAGKKLIFIIIVVLTISIIHFVNKTVYPDYTASFSPVGATDFIKSNLPVESIRLYNDFDTGGYLELNGIKTFIDSRAELFTKKINKKEDIFTDFCSVSSGKLHYKNFIKKYNLTHFLVRKGDIFDTYLSMDPDYKKLYEDDRFLLYEKKPLQE